MSEPDFQPYRRTVEEILGGSEYFIIPRFQRPYDWDATNVDDFWRDVIDDNKVGYFIGPMVGWRHAETAATRSIVDGQQRLMTITLLLAAIRESFSELGNADLSKGIQRFIERPDRENQPRFVIQPESPSAFINNAFLSAAGDRTIPPSTDEEKQIKIVGDGFRKRIAGALEGQPKAGQVKRLRTMRDNLLGLRIIWVELSNEDEAYVVFETLNSRGKDLEVADLLKNLLLNKLRGSGNTAADGPRESWMRMRLQFEESEVNIDVNRFILHWWLSNRAYVAQKKLFRAIKGKVRTRDEAKDALAELEADAPLYRSMYEPESRIWRTEESEIPRTLRALVDFRVVQPAPLILALLRARRDNTVSLSEIVKTLQTIERFHFQFTAITQQSSSGGISEMYAKCGREISTESDRSQRHQRLRTFRQGLASRIPNADVFDKAFVDRLILTDERSREKALVHYVLREFLRASHPNTRVDGGTVEHLLSQSEISGGAAREEVVGSIGNLLWISGEINGRLDNKRFSAKKTILAQTTVSSHYDVSDIVDKNVWTASEISARAAAMAIRARTVIWKLPV